MPFTTRSSAIVAATECLQELVRDVQTGAFENDQEEEIESMEAAGDIADSDARSQDCKRAKLDICEASLKSASAQVVVANTLIEYARFVE